jgi:hypothetical protein
VDVAAIAAAAESFGLQSLAFVDIHTSVGRAARSLGSPLVHGRFGP